MSLAIGSDQVPAEVHLRHRDLVTVERKDLGVAEARAVGPRRLVRHDDLVAVLDDPLEVERSDRLRVRPAALPVGIEVYPDIGWTVEPKSGGQVLLHGGTFARHVPTVSLLS